MRGKIIGVALGCVAGANPAAAEPVTLDCNFTRVSALEGKDFVPERFGTGPATRFSMTFILDRGRAYMLGNLGSANLESQTVAGGGVIFIETAPSGVKQVTAIDKAGNAAHSRHTFVPLLNGDWMLFPQQFYGRCVRRGRAGWPYGELRCASVLNRSAIF